MIRIGYMASGQHYPNSDILVSNYIVTQILEYKILMLLKYLGLLLETLDHCLRTNESNDITGANVPEDERCGNKLCPTRMRYCVKRLCDLALFQASE